ncbi:MAG TPA: PAS domain S-box protein, partial [Anaerolineae bacterium]|nr:PAS domain S-box protein [Anaerolineae bacterium]
MMSADHPEKLSQSPSPAELHEAYTQLQAKYDALREDYGRLQQQFTGYQALFQQRQYGVIFLGLDTTILDINERAAEMIGYTREELVGHSSAEFIVPDESNHSQEIRKQLLEGHSPPSYQRTFIHRDGRRIVAAIDSNLVRDEQGNPAFYQIFARDITERSRMEDALQLSRKLVSTLSYLATLPLELEAVLQAAVDGLVEVLNVPQCSIILADAVTQKLRVAADHPAPGVESYAGWQLPNQSYDQFKEQMNIRDIVYVEDIYASPFLPQAQAIIEQRHTCSLLMAPIIMQDDVVGLVACSTTDEPRRFSQLEIELVQTVTNLIGNRIEQTYLYEAERRQWAHSRTLQELGLVLTSSLDLDDVLNTIGNQILSLMDVSSCTIMLLESSDELVWRAMIGLPEEIRRIGRQRVGEGLSGWVAAHRQTLQV